MISNLIIKYLSGEASQEEITEIYAWIETSEANKIEFIALKKTWAIAAVTKVDLDDEWKMLQQKKSYKKPISISLLFKYAAVLAIFITIGAISWKVIFTEPTKTNAIVLELEDQNRSIKLDDKKALFKIPQKIITTQNDHELVYENKSTIEAVSYHTLKIPNGKNFKVTLSDSTVVFLNAGTILKYPKQFNDRSNRQVFLEGEAYFEVKKDIKRPFLVTANGLSIEVLGTKFNVNAYTNNLETYCVLVEGSVKVFEEENVNNKSLLVPNQKITWNSKSKTLVSQQVKTTHYTAWMRHEIVFEGVHFSEISEKLERSFDVEIENNSAFLESQTFTGTINTKTSSLENILDILSIDTPFKYKKEGSTIIISNK